MSFGVVAGEADAADAVSCLATGPGAVLSFVDTGGREENKRGVMTMTSAMSASASSVRLSMQVVELP